MQEYPVQTLLPRGLKELRALSIAYTSKTGSIYAHDPALKLNSLLLDMTQLLGLLKRGQGIDVDFDNEFIPAEKSDALYSYKKKRGYFPGVMTSGPLIIGLENRQGNSNVKFEQVEGRAVCWTISRPMGCTCACYVPIAARSPRNLSRNFFCGQRRSTSAPAVVQTADRCMSIARNDGPRW